MPESKRIPQYPGPNSGSARVSMPSSPSVSQRLLSTDFSPHRTNFLGAEAVDDMFACPTTREDKRTAPVNCIPICPKSPWRAQHSPGFMPSVNVTAGECLAFSSEPHEEIANGLRRLQVECEYVSDVKDWITLPPAEILAYSRTSDSEGAADPIPEAEAGRSLAGCASVRRPRYVSM